MDPLFLLAKQDGTSTFRAFIDDAQAVSLCSANASTTPPLIPVYELEAEGWTGTTIRQAIMSKRQTNDERRKVLFFTAIGALLRGQSELVTKRDQRHP
jgi:hypothetical protein